MVDMNLVQSTYPAYSFFRYSKQPMMILVTMDFPRTYAALKRVFFWKGMKERHRKALQDLCNMPTTQTGEREIREENFQAITSTHGFYLHGLNGVNSTP